MIKDKIKCKQTSKRGLAKESLLSQIGITLNSLEDSAKKQKGHRAYTLMRIETALRKNRIQWAPAQDNTIRGNRTEGKNLAERTCRIQACGFNNKTHSTRNPSLGDQEIQRPGCGYLALSCRGPGPQGVIHAAELGEGSTIYIQGGWWLSAPA